jgi:FkbM family methyltransferase
METQIVNFSQNREQEVILEFFKDKESGTFCSIGENDGKTLSNVRALALYKNFCGVLVEPSPKAFFKLKQLYQETKGCFYLYNFALGNHNGSMKFYDSGTHLNKGDVGLLSSGVESELKRFPGTQYEEIEVKVFRWKTALNRFQLKKFDCVSIDAESMDIDILKQMDLTEVKLLVIEWNSVPDNKEKILEHTSKFGMTNVIYTSGENLIITR